MMQLRANIESLELALQSLSKCMEVYPDAVKTFISLGPMSELFNCHAETFKMDEITIVFTPSWRLREFLSKHRLTESI